MDPQTWDRAMTEREQAVLDALLSVDFGEADELRRQARTARVVGVCGCDSAGSST